MYNWLSDGKITVFFLECQKYEKKAVPLRLILYH